MPIRDVFVGNAGCHIEHDDATLAIDVIPIPETTKLLLTRSIPDIKLNRAQVLPQISVGPFEVFWRTHCCETEWVDLDTQSSDIFLLEFACKMSLDEGCLERYEVLAMHIGESQGRRHRCKSGLRIAYLASTAISH